MPPLKSPAAFHEQRRSLERARTEDYLKRKIRSRPERSELVRMHILEETSAEPSLQAKQLKLKRARLADDLNEKIAQRPGPMELVEKNILPVESSLKEAIIVGQVNYPKVADSSSFDEDSSDALSPEQPASHESQGSVPSPLEARVSEPPPSATSVSPTQVVSQLPVGPESGETLFLAEQPPLPPSLTNGTTVPAAKPLPTLIKQSQPKSASEKSQRSKKAKELKPKVKKLKYHQYIPPDQKQDKGAPPMDSSYAKILQQQQLFLQLQILNQQQQQQQQQHYNYQTILPAPPKPAGEALGSAGGAPTRSLSATGSSSGSGAPGPSGLVRQNSTSLAGKPGALPANLDDMKVAELKQELKLRSLPVSGTKTDLIERLRAYQEQVTPASPGAPKAPATSLLPKAGEVVVAFPTARLSTGPALVAAGLAPAEVVVATVTSNGVVKFGSTGSTPPVSPTPSERSLLSTGDENSTPGDSFGEMVTSPVTQLTLQASPLQVLVKEEGPRPGACCRSPGARAELEGRDKDQMLQEKDKQIEELTRMLRQKQQLVEWLRLQLEQEKRAQQPTPTPAPAPLALGPAVKQESNLASCQLSRRPPGPELPFSPNLAAPAAPHADARALVSPAVVVKQEAVGSEPEPAPALVTLGPTVKQENSFTSCQLSRQPLGPELPFGPSLAAPAAPHAEACALAPPVVVVKQEAVPPEPEAAPAPQLLLGPQGPSLVKGVTPPPLLTDSAGTHLVLTVTKNTDSPGLASGSPQQRGQSSPSKVTLASGSLLPPPSQPRPSTQPGPKPLSQPESPAPGPPGHMDLEPPPQPLFGTPASQPKKEPPGYEEAVSQQPRRQENGSSSQQMDDLFDILIQSGEISADFKEPGKEKAPPTAACSSPLAAQPSPAAELPQAAPPPSGSPALPGRLEDFLESSTGLPLLTGGHEGPEPLSLIDDLHSQMLSSSAILDHPPSPMDTSELHFAPEPSGVGLDLADGHLDSVFGCAWPTGWERSPDREEALPRATMGNVLAASSPPAGPPPPPAPPLVGLPPPPPSPPGFTLPPLGGGLGAGAGTGRGSERTPGTAAASAGGTADDGACGCLPNPGTFEECHRKCKELFPIQMEGVKLTVNKGLSNHFQVNHTVALSTIGESNYHFGVTYVGTKQLSPTEAFPVLVGDMDNSGSLNAQVIHQLGPGLRSKMAIQTQQSKFVNWQVDGEYRGSDFTAAVTLGNPDVLVGSGILVAHYLQSITPCLALGGELVYHRRPGEEGAVMSLAGKYTLNNWLATVTLGQAGMHATYYHKASDQLQVGVEFEASTRMQDTSVSFGYQLDLPKANLLFKGSVDSNWIVGATLEKKLPPLPLTLALGAFLNHRKNKFQCGFGLTIG